MRRRLLPLVLCLAGWLAGAPGAGAQTAPDPLLASLVADRISVDAGRTLSAEGNVEVFFDGARLTASRIVYDAGADAIRIEGPIRLIDASGSVLIADSAELDTDLTNGILRSARLVLDQQLQLAASEIARDGGRYTRLRRVVASSCQVCASNPTPLWEIRASGVVHDQEERQLYFEDAQVRIAGIPVFYFPRLRLPDPTLDRARGFLIPDVASSNQLGFGFKIPYFLPIGDSADVTLTPYLAPGTRTLEGRYRQVFENGEMRFDGALTFWDDILDGEARAYLFGNGAFRLPQGYNLTFQLQTVSDPTYLNDYDYSGLDRLTSAVFLSRVDATELTLAGVIGYESLREADLEDESALPRYVGVARNVRALPTGALGGDAWLTVDGRIIYRTSDENITGLDDARIGVAGDWSREWVGPQGLVFGATGALALDAYAIRNDDLYPSTLSRATPAVAVGLRWPLEKIEAGGARQVLEPVAQLAWSQSYGGTPPNEDSTVVEFDEGNLFALSRYPGVDRYEQGLRANLGFSWMRSVPDGLLVGVTAGRIFRFDDEEQFPQGTGLTGTRSDWLAAFRLRMNDDFWLTSRSLFDDSLDFTQSETRLDWVGDWGALSTSYLWNVEVPEEDATQPISEWALAASYEINRNWVGRADWRYDFIAGQAARAGLGLLYRNECVGVDLSVSRRFTSSTPSEPITSFDVRLSLNGFGSDNDGRAYRRSCTG
jgi:LPS-assembly protein